MWYRQQKRVDEDMVAASVALKIRGRWIDGTLLDSGGNVLCLPCEVKKGELYTIEARKQVKKKDV